jgi:enoyl-CoA hydratase/carnithine racemase
MLTLSEEPKKEGEMENQTILYDVDDAVATITLNRPEVMNAINRESLKALEERVAALRRDSQVRVVLITGAGSKAFSAGADLKERATMSPPEVKRFIHTIGSVFQQIAQLNKPVVAALNGIAFGGGLELALAADIRLAADTARVGFPEARLAIIPGAGGTQRLPRIVGSGKAKELIFTGRPISATEACRIGLVNHLYPASQLMDECRNMAAAIAQAGPVAVKQAKIAIDDGLEHDLQSGLAIESKAYWVCIPTEDRLEGLAAFKEKRTPVYKGR